MALSYGQWSSINSGDPCPAVCHEGYKVEDLAITHYRAYTLGSKYRIDSSGSTQSMLRRVPISLDWTPEVFRSIESRPSFTP